jgi:hypothetical protein
VPDSDKKRTVDPVAALTSIVADENVPDLRQCGGNLAVFDGRRRYDVVFTFLRREKFDALNTTARICKAEYRPLSGIKQDIVDVSTVPALYVSYIDLPPSEGGYSVAERISTVFLFGAVAATLTEMTIDGHSFSFSHQ